MLEGIEGAGPFAWLEVPEKPSFPPISTALHHSAALLSGAAAGKFPIPAVSRSVQSFTSQQISLDCPGSRRARVFLWIKTEMYQGRNEPDYRSFFGKEQETNYLGRVAAL